MTDVNVTVRPTVVTASTSPAVVVAPVSSVFGRVGAVTAAASDYDASQVDNDSSVSGATVADALNALLALAPPVSSDYLLIATKADLPAAVAGVITMPALSTWIFLDDVDLTGDRIECAGIATIVGFGPETCKIRSTGLGAGEALISSVYTLTLRSLGLYADAGSTCVRVDGTGQPTLPALDWFSLNFNEGSATPGKAAEITEIGNSINILLGVFGDGFYFDGAASTIGFVDTIFVANSGKYGIKVEATASISSRLRLTSSAVVAIGTGLDVPQAAIAQSEGFVLFLCSLSGPGTRVTGITYTDDEARWIECRGITNTTRVGSYFMQSNATSTTIVTPGTYVKAAGTTTANPTNQRFDHADNRLTYVSELVETFTIQVSAAFVSGNNKEVLMAVYKGNIDGTPAAPITAYYAASTTNSGGRAEGVAYQEIVTLSEGDYLEIWITNNTDTTAVTLESVNVQVRQT